MKKLMIILCLLPLLSCHDGDSEREGGGFAPLGVSVCGVKDPAWLTEEVGRQLQHSAARPTQVWVYEGGEADCVAITDVANSALTEALRFYTCGGAPITDADACASLTRLLRQGDFRLVWENEAVSKLNVLAQPQRCVRMVEMQGAEAEAEGSVLAYTTKAECR